VGVKAEASGGSRIPVDGYGRTANQAIYLVGDADGGLMTANKAQAQGRIAARHLAGAEAAPFDLPTLIQPVYTEPQVAQVGDVSGEKSVRIRFTQSLKSHLLPDGDGFLELYYEKDGRLLGAVAVGPQAADVLSPVAVAIKLGGRLDDLADLYAAYPSLSELPFIAARSAN
jgi:dihydrolipoamide dehydrogenase